MTNQVFVYDTTLRDGTQREGISYSLNDKLKIAHATEIVAAIRKKRLRYKEVPVNIHNSSYSKAKGQSAWGSFRIFFDILLNKIFK